MASGMASWLCTETALDREFCPTFGSTGVPAAQGAWISGAEARMDEPEQHGGLSSWGLPGGK